MKLNNKKTTGMVFITAKTRDVLQELMHEEEAIEVEEETKLLGVQVTSDLKWNANTAYVSKIGNNKLWTLRRFKSIGSNTDELVIICCKHKRSILEYAAVFGIPISIKVHQKQE